MSMRHDASTLLVRALTVFIILIVATQIAAWWAVRYPFGRLVADIGAAVGIGALLSLRPRHASHGTPIGSICTAP